MIFIAALFVVSEGLDATGVTAWVGRRLIASAAGSRTRLILLIMTLVALLTALVNVKRGGGRARAGRGRRGGARRAPVVADCCCRWPSARTPGRCWR
ncbi:MAG TPA: hypothetical protein VNZ62_20065 [Capillimicrobium sp.]|nr:hypothetical protein [Capillimicrobium sp.]